MLNVIGSESTNTGIALSLETTPAVAKKEYVGRITSSPGCKSIAIKAISKASVPEEIPMADFTPKYSQSDFSNLSTSGPKIKY